MMLGLSAARKGRATAKAMSKEVNLIVSFIRIQGWIHLKFRSSASSHCIPRSEPSIQKELSSRSRHLPKNMKLLHFIRQAGTLFDQGGLATESKITQFRKVVLFE